TVEKWQNYRSSSRLDKRAPRRTMLLRSKARRALLIIDRTVGIAAVELQLSDPALNRVVLIVGHGPVGERHLGRNDAQKPLHQEAALRIARLDQRATEIGPERTVLVGIAPDDLAAKARHVGRREKVVQAHGSVVMLVTCTLFWPGCVIRCVPMCSSIGRVGSV